MLYKLIHDLVYLLALISLCGTNRTESNPLVVCAHVGLKGMSGDICRLALACLTQI